MDAGAGSDDNASEIHDPSLPVPRNPSPRHPLRWSDFNSHNSQESYAKMLAEMSNLRQRSIRAIDTATQNVSQKSESEGSSSNNDLEINHDKMTANLEEQNKPSLTYLQNQSETSSPKNGTSPKRKSSDIKNESPTTKQTTNNFLSFRLNNRCIYLIIGLIILCVTIIACLPLINILFIKDVEQELLESMEDVKTKFRNQESHIWNDISSGINEVITKTPKVPSIILLFANETTEHTMDCLASALAHVSSTILGGDSYLRLKPKDFGDDPGEIIDALNKSIPKKKAVIIYDVLNINVEAIKALHNLCDRVNPLVKEAVYIITMQTDSYESSQSKLCFVERQIYHKFSRSMDQDTLMALVARITDGLIISVQPEPHLRYC